MQDPSKTEEAVSFVGKFMEDNTPLFTSYAVKIVGVLVILFIAWIIAVWCRRLTAKAMGKAKVDQTLSKFIARAVGWVILVFAILGCLSVFGFQMTSVAALVAAAGLAVGLAFQGSLSNFAAGVMLLVFRPFKVGDVVCVSGETGKIDEIGIFTTTMDTADNRRLILPNSGVFGSNIENITFHSTRRVAVDVGVDYSADIDTTREVLLKAANSLDNVLKDPEPAVVLTGLGASSVDFAVRVWCATSDFWPVSDALTRAVKMHLDGANIGIPFPQMDVHLDQPAG